MNTPAFVAVKLWRALMRTSVRSAGITTTLGPLQPLQFSEISISVSAKQRRVWIDQLGVDALVAVAMELDGVFIFGDTPLDQPDHEGDQGRQQRYDSSGHG